MKWHKFLENSDSSPGPYRININEYDSGRISANFEHLGLSLVTWKAHKNYPSMCSIHEGNLTGELKNPGVEVFFVITIVFAIGDFPSYDIITDGEKIGYVKNLASRHTINAYVKGDNCIVTDEVPAHFVNLTSAQHNAIMEMGRLLDS